MTFISSHSDAAAARHVLTSPSIIARTGPHIDGGRIDWEGLLNDATMMSSGERFVVEIARRLYSGEALPSAHELSGRLDVLNARRVAEAHDLVAGATRADQRQAA